MSYGGHLRTLRAEARLFRAEVARRASVPVSTLRNWENDRGFPGVPACLRRAEALGMPAERLAEGVDDPAQEEAEAAEAKPRRAGARNALNARPAAPCRWTASTVLSFSGLFWYTSPTSLLGRWRGADHALPKPACNRNRS